MAEAAANILGPAITEALKWAAATIKRQCYYLCCFTTIITTLKQEAKDLEDTTKDLLGKVETAKNDVQVITSAVETWLMKSGQIKDETDGILKEVSTVGSGCLKLRARFSLSKRAKKTSDSLKELRGKCTFVGDALAQPLPPPAREAVSLEGIYEFDSRKKIEEDIMNSLRGGDLNMMGISGMGGLGKTTMAKRIMNRALKEALFKEIVMGVVSQTVDKSKIQLEIGESLGLLHLKDENSEARKAQKLRARLSGTDRILLVLDDVWKKLEFEDIGIPCNHKGCTILITSRNNDALREMDVHKVFRMKVLSEEDSMLLFEKRVGTCVDDTKLTSMKKEVVNECKGLPIALVAVGAALKDEMNVRVWKNALRQLRQSDPDIPEWIANVFNPLKLSYNVVGPKHKVVFLLCCLYPEDAVIPLERLTYFCMGLGIFEGGVRTVEEARDMMCSLTRMLKSRSLLLDSKTKNDDLVRMHDVVRDFGIFIAKQEKYIDGNDCTWISSSLRSELPTKSSFPNLRLLFLDRDLANEEFQLDNSFIERIKDLYVLSIENLSLKSLPQTTQSLKNLNTLVFFSCKKLETLSIVSELLNLQILVCRFCGSVKEVPPEMKGLNRLKLLDLSRCKNLERIGRGIISSLVGLEELKMRGSFKKWEGDDREERENAGLRELEALTKLRWLEIEIEDPALAAENIRLSPNMDRFEVRFSVFESIDFINSRFNKKMSLYLNEERCLGYWIEKQLLKDTECLYLTGNGVNNEDLAKVENIRWLELKSSRMKEIETKCFASLEHLELFDLPKLEKIWDDGISPYFLPHLKVLKIKLCQMMEQVFRRNGDSRHSNDITKMFLKLEEVYLTYLPNVISFYHGIEVIEFPQLRMLRIESCRKMKSMVSKWMGSNPGGGSSNEDSHKPQKGLKEFTICGYEGCTSLITSSITKELANMNLKQYDEMDEDKGMSGDQRTLLFPKLEELYLVDLTELESFCEWKWEDELPSLRKVEIGNCPNMKQLWKTSSLRQNDQTKDCLQQLQYMQWLELRKCESLNVIETEWFSPIEHLRLFKLPKLKKIWDDKISSYFLPQLKVLKIESCEMMEHVFLWNADSQNSHDATKMFLKLEEVYLEDLPNMTSFYEQIKGIEFPQLRKLEIQRCGKMKSMVSKWMGSNENNSEGGSSSSNKDTYKPQEVLFGCLNDLNIDWNPFGDIVHGVSLFGGLERLTIQRCEGGTRWITSSIATTLVNLTHLIIKECDEMVQVIKDDEVQDMNGSQTTLLLPKLQELSFIKSPKLVSFCECDVELPSLSQLEIIECPNIKNLTLGSLAAPNLESFATDFVNHLHFQAPFNGLKKLAIREIKLPLNYYEINESQFNGLKLLNIAGYEGSVGLFSASITRTLMNLTKLTISGCYEMVNVIEDEEEKEKVVSGSGQSTIRIFPKLEKLELIDLFKLESFCEWKCDVELPSLREVVIHRITSMKYFTLGRLVTPNLKSVIINYEGCDDVEDLNVVVQQKYEIYQKGLENYQKKKMELEKGDEEG